MPRVQQCTVCASPARRKIDKALASGASHRELAKEHELGRGSMDRHAASHLVRAVAVAVDAREVSRGDALLATALGWESELAELYQLAKADGAFGADRQHRAHCTHRDGVPPAGSRGAA